MGIILKCKLEIGWEGVN